MSFFLLCAKWMAVVPIGLGKTQNSALALTDVWVSVDGLRMLISYSRLILFCNALNSRIL